MLRLPNIAAKTHAMTRAGTDSIASACHVAVDRSTGSPAVQEREAAILLRARRRETSTPATIVEIVAQKRSCRWSHTNVDIAAARSACTYIDTAAIQAIGSASAADSPLRPRRRPRFTHTRYAVSNTGAFASHRLVTRSMCGRYAARSRFTMSRTVFLLSPSRWLISRYDCPSPTSFSTLGANRSALTR